MRASKRPISTFTVRSLIRLIFQYRALSIAAFLSLALAAAINLGLPEIIRQMLNRGATAYFLEHPGSTGALLIGLFALQGIAFYLRSLFFTIIGHQVVCDLRKQAFHGIINRPVDYFDTNRVGDLVSRLGSDTQLLFEAISYKFSVFIRYSLQVAAGVVLMATISLRLTMALVLLLPVVIGLSVLFGKRLKIVSKQLQVELGASTGLAEETFSAARLVRAFNREDAQTARYSASIDGVLALGLRRSRIAAFFSSFVSFLMNVTIVIVLLLGLALVASQTLSFGDLTAFLLYALLVAVSFAFVANGYAEFLQALGAGERIMECINPEQPRADRSAFATLPEPVHGAITFTDVSFVYPARIEQEVLHDVNFSIAAGKTTALVGPSGSGKSTIVSLILSLYTPLKGEIRWDGVPLSSLDPRLVREHIAVVPQDAPLFALSIADNLRFGKEHATETELREACRSANILSFIESLPQGFATQIGERGVQLSGGQRQRLALARALLRNPELLILDEATSALDSESEHLIRMALREIMRNRTVLVIAHRLATVQDAHHVIVLEHGSVVQEGSHDTLSAAEGLYRQLVLRQELLHT